MKLKECLVGKVIVVDDKMQKDYSYTLSQRIGDLASDFHQLDFFPQLAPQEMLNYGIFEGRYLNDCQNEFPEEWFLTSQQKRSVKSNSKINYFQIKSRLSLTHWREKK